MLKPSQQTQTRNRGLIKPFFLTFYSQGGDTIRWLRLAQDLGKKKFQRILHIGAYLGEEFKEYQKLGIDEVFWVEPQPLYAKELRQSFGSGSVFEYAVNSFCGFVDFGVLNKDDSSSILSPISRGEDLYTVNEVIQVKSIRLPCLLEQLPGGTGPSVVVLDVQGSEAAILSAANQSHLANTDVIVVECSSPPIYENSLGYYHIKDVMRTLGFYSTRLFFEKKDFHGDVMFIRRNFLVGSKKAKFFIFYGCWQVLHQLFTRYAFLQQKLRSRFA